MYAPIPMVPGPVTVSRDVLDALARDYPSGQIDADFMPLYRSTESCLQHLMETRNRVIVMTGEGMLALWAGLKSALLPGDRVLVVSTGVFGDGIADMARSIGAETRCIGLGYDSSITEEHAAQIGTEIQQFRPKMLCGVHCETPSGTLSSLDVLGRLKEQYEIPLLYTDIVSSLAGTPVRVDAWNIDIAVGGSQKCLSAPPSMCFASVSPRAWQVIHEVQYQGYDALLPFETIYSDGRCPYTPNWHGMAALHTALAAVFSEGLHHVIRRHSHVAELCRQGLEKLGIGLWPKKDAIPSPTVTAAVLPPEFSSVAAWRKALRDRGLVVAGSFGSMKDAVFRIGHMGEQARPALLARALDVMDDALHTKRSVMV